MDSNAHSIASVGSGPPDDPLAALAADVDALAAQDLGGVPETVRAQVLLAWRRLLDRQHGLW